MKVLLLIVALVLWIFAAIVVLANQAVLSHSAVEWFVIGSPFFAASFLPIP